MTEQIKYTSDEKAKARHTDIVTFLTERGEEVKRSGSEWVWMNGSEKITIRGCVWFNHYRMEGGNAVDFVCSFCGVDYPSAMRMLIGDPEDKTEFKRIEPPHTNSHGAFVLPERYRDVRRVFAYLNKSRCIDPDIINYFIAKNLLYEDEPYHNAVFVGNDEKGVPRHAHKHGSVSSSKYKCNAAGSDPKHSFHHIGTSDTIYVFEAPIDMLSFISMHPDNWQRDSYVALCSVAPAALLHQIEMNPQLHRICLCLDNDSAGHAACQRIAALLRQQGDYSVSRITPTLKDWNEDICSGEEESLAPKM